MSETLSKNMRLLDHNTLGGFGGVGEGMALQVTNKGKRVLWIAHEGPPKNFTGLDVTDPKNTKVCLLYTSPSPRDVEESRMPSSA